MTIVVVDIEGVEVRFIAGLVFPKGQVLFFERIFELLLSAELLKGMSLHGG